MAAQLRGKILPPRTRVYREKARFITEAERKVTSQTFELTAVIACNEKKEALIFYHQHFFVERRDWPIDLTAVVVEEEDPVYIVSF